MKNLKLLFFVFFTISVALLSSCKKEEPAPVVPTCTPPVASKNLIGTWTVNVKGQTKTGKVTFNADGSLSDSEDFLVSGSINGIKLTDKTWTMSADEKKLDIKVAKDFNSLTYSFIIASNECNSIKVTSFAFGEFTLTK